MLQALHDEKVRCLLFGDMQWPSTVTRATMDIDIPVLPEAENAKAVVRALHHFGTPLQNLTREDLLTDGTVFQLGAAQKKNRYYRRRVRARF
jgi:hypothetical protein